MKTFKDTTKKDNILARTLLGDIIEQLTKETQAYANKPDANEWILEKRNKHLAQLHQVYNAIPNLFYTPIWTQLEEAFAQYQKIDPSLDGHLVLFSYRESGSRHSHITLPLLD